MEQLIHDFIIAQSFYQNRQFLKFRDDKNLIFVNRTLKSLLSVIELSDVNTP